MKHLHFSNEKAREVSVKHYSGSLSPTAMRQKATSIITAPWIVYTDHMTEGRDPQYHFLRLSGGQFEMAVIEKAAWDRGEIAKVFTVYPTTRKTVAERVASGRYTAIAKQ